ncbi:hypothetical protein WN944_008492 [Citrus x changshan-huyou]|uniref:Uncharacterized protein n=1 Tax=Citrus x changshan-huyou TaxID=2935761 RepID=A0AAP0MN15_9ROSI
MLIKTRTSVKFRKPRVGHSLKASSQSKSVPNSARRPRPAPAKSNLMIKHIYLLVIPMRTLHASSFLSPPADSGMCIFCCMQPNRCYISGNLR